jgi:hypothetical protein
MSILTKIDEYFILKVLVNYLIFNLLFLVLYFGDFVGKHTTSQGVLPAKILVSHQNLSKYYPTI